MQLGRETRQGPLDTQQCQRVLRVDPYGSPTIASDLRTFDRTETTLDVEYAHTIAPGATLVLAETPGGTTAGGVSMSQVVTAEKYVVAHHLGDVISQSFIATEQGIGSAAIRALRGATPPPTLTTSRCSPAQAIPGPPGSSAAAPPSTPTR